MTHHTPGPWSLISVTCKGSHNKRSVTSPTRRILDISLDDDEQAANARLIAAAPELLEAVKNLVSEFTDDCRLGYVTDARAAIAKAEGAAE